MVQGAALAQRHTGKAALGRIGRLADRLRHLACLAVAEADPALLVADDHEGGEAKAPAALHHLGDPIDVDELVDELAVALFRPSFPFPLTCHNNHPFPRARARRSSYVWRMFFSAN